MADITRYDQPAQAQFMNYYQPIPFQEIMQAGAQQQQAYNIGRASIDQMSDEASNLSYIPNTVDEKYIKETVIPTMKELSDKYSQLDYGNPEVMRQFQREVGKKIDSNRVNDIQKSAASWAESQKMMAGMKAKGVTPYKPFDYTGYDSSTSGIYTYNPEATLDYEGTLQQYFNNVGEEVLGGIELVNGHYTQKHGRSLTKLQKYVEDNYNVMASNPAIQQLIDSYGIDPNDKEAVKEVLLNEVPKYVTSKRQVLSKASKPATFEGFTDPLRVKEDIETLGNSSPKDIYKNYLNTKSLIDKLEQEQKVALKTGNAEVATQKANEINSLRNSPQFELGEDAVISVLNRSKEFLSDFYNSMEEINGLSYNDLDKFTSYLIEKSVDKDLPMSSIFDTREALKSSGVNIDKLSEGDLKTIHKIYHNNKPKLREVREELQDNIKEIGNQGTQRTSTILHIDEDGYVAVPGDKGKVASNFLPILKDLDFAAGDYKVNVWDTDGHRRKPNKKESERISEHNYNRMDYGRVNITDDGNISLIARTYDEDSPKATGKYEVEIPSRATGVVNALAKDFLSKKDLYTYSQIKNPSVEAAIRREFKYNDAPDVINLDEFGVTAAREGKGYRVYNEDGTFSKSLYSKEGLKRLFYKQSMLMDRDAFKASGAQSIEEYANILDNYFSKPYND